MGTEHSLVPEWLRQGQGGSHQSQAHHRYHGDGGGPGTPGRNSNRNSDPPLRHSGSYTPPGRRSLGPDRPSYDRPSQFRSTRDSLSLTDADRGESQGRGQDVKQSPEGKPRRLHDRGSISTSRGPGDQANEGGGTPQDSGPSLPTAMPTRTGSLASNVQKAAFERNFPVLGDKFGRFMPSMSSVPSPRRPTGGDGGEGWSSRLADVPSPGARVGPGANGLGSSGEEPVRTPRMAEALQQALQEQQQKLTLNAISEGQKQEDLVMKKMKQLIPLKPTMPKNLLLKPSKRPLHSSTPQPAPSAAKPVVRRPDEVTGSLVRGNLPASAHVSALSRLQIPGAASILAAASPTLPSPAGSGTPVSNGSKSSGATQKRNDFFKGLRKKALSPNERAPEGNGIAGEGGSRAAEQGLEVGLLRSDSLGVTSGGLKQRSETASNLPEEAPSIRSSNGAVSNLSKAVQNGHVVGTANGIVGAAEERRTVGQGLEISRSVGKDLENGDETLRVSGEDLENGTEGARVNGECFEGLQNGADGLRVKGESLEGLRNGAGDVEVVADPEEEEAAFLRSLGWTGPENDDEEGALTEEEIRAFFSQTASLNLQPKVPYQNGAQTYEPTSPVHVAPNLLQRAPTKVEAIVGSYSSLSSGFSSSDDESDY